MNEKIGIIVPVQNEIGYAELQKSLAQVQVPQNMEVELIRIDDCGSDVVKAYQLGQQSTDAKYKVYLRDTVRIRDANFLLKLLAVFKADNTIGVVGFAGATVLPTSGLVTSSQKRVGSLMIQGSLEQWEPVQGASQSVVAVDDGLFATQYDIPWQATQYKNALFAVEAYCLDMRRRGYQTVVASTDVPAVEYTANDITFSKQEQDIFLDTYSAELFPLVTIMIPTFNRPQYFEIALNSVLNQTYRNLDIVVSDDGTNNQTEMLIQKYLARDKRIKYIHHENFTFYDNWRWMMAYDNPKAEYINWLMDDDAFYPEKIAKMMDYYIFEEGITIVTSARTIIDANGNIIPHECVPGSAPLTEVVTRIPGAEVGRLILTKLTNFVGEPSTVLVAKKNLKNNYWGWNKIPIKYFLADYPVWLHLASKGDAIYIPEELSYFRRHAGQDQESNAAKLRGYLNWAIVIHYAYRQGLFFKDDNEYVQAIAALCPWMIKFINSIVSENIAYDKKTMRLLMIYLKSFVKTMDRVIAAKDC